LLVGADIEREFAAHRLHDRPVGQQVRVAALEVLRRHRLRGLQLSDTEAAFAVDAGVDDLGFFGRENMLR
jgi:hypothetical protein